MCINFMFTSVCISNLRYTTIMNKIMNKYSDSPSLYKIIKCCTLEDVEFIRHTDFQRHKNNQNGFGWTLLHHASTEGNKTTVNSG